MESENLFTLYEELLNNLQEEEEKKPIESNPVESGLPQRIISALTRLESQFLMQAKKSKNFSQLSDESQKYIISTGMFLLGYQTILSLDPEGETLLINFNDILSNIFRSRLRAVFNQSRGKVDSKLTTAINRLRPKFEEIANGWNNVKKELQERKEVKDQKKEVGDEDSVESGQVNASTDLPKPD
jgi:hypothetical protein